MAVPYCSSCGAKIADGDRFCPRCGSVAESKIPGSNVVTVTANVRSPEMIIVTTPTVPGYRVRPVVGIVTGLTARTRGRGGKFVAGIQSMLGGEVSAFTSEIEKAREEAVERLKEKARKRGANASLGLDVETSDVLQGTVLISATGTAGVIEPE